jgi:tRNA threonylcarbamoyladenosine biosynthesis protein TsaB
LANFLLIETASDVCSVAVANDNGPLVHLQNASREHAATLAPMIKDAMHQAVLSYGDLSCIGINGGPGSYTGLRIGLSTAKGICYAANVPLVMIDSLLAYANGLVTQQRPGDDEIIVATVDNRRDELFYAAFDNKLNRLRDVTLTVATNDALKQRLGDKCIVIGSAVNKLSNVYSANDALRYVDVMPSAVNLMKPVAAMFAEKRFESVAYSEPFYYKDVYIATKKV